MGKTRRIGDLDIEHNPAHSRREWAVQRIGWTIMVAFLGSALAGLLGPGPLSNVAASEGALRVEYEKHCRYESPATLKVHYTHTEGQPLQVAISSEFLQDVQVERVQPEPKEIKLGESESTFVFAAEGAGTKQVIIFYRPAIFGENSGQVSSGRSRLRIEQFYWP